MSSAHNAHILPPAKNDAALNYSEGHLSRRVIELRADGVEVEHHLSLVAVSRDECGEIRAIRITPFQGETHSTTWHDSSITVDRTTQPPILIC